MGSLAFTTPLLLAGLALLSLPILAHLARRRARRTIVFPSNALLRTAAAAQARFARLRRLLLLLLRVAAAACIVLAFTRPVWMAAGQSVDEAGEAVAVVVVLDVSASMAAAGDGAPSALERGRGWADRQLARLRVGQDRANVVLAGAQPTAIFPQLSGNLPALRDELADVVVTGSRADWPGALALAERLLEPHRGPRRIWIVSDRQASNWSDLTAGRAEPSSTMEESDPAPSPARRPAVRRRTLVALADFELPENDNVGLSEPRQYPPRPLAGQSCELSVRVANHGRRPQQVRVTLELRISHGPDELGPQAFQEQTLTLAPGERREAIFAAVCPTVGWLEAAFAIGDDALAIDNRAYLVVEPAGRRTVLIVSDEGNVDQAARGSAAWYMLRALSPFDDRAASDPSRTVIASRQANPYDVRLVRSAELPEALRDDVAAVFGGYLGRLSPAAVQALHDYVVGGGGVLLFCGDGPVGENLAALETAHLVGAAGKARDSATNPALASGGGLPWSRGSRPATGRDVAPLRITGGRWQSRWFRDFDEQSQLAVQAIQFHRTWRPAALAPGAEALLTFSDDSPALSFRGAGKGRWLLAGFSPDATSSDLARHGAFVAWMQILAAGLRPDEALVSPRYVGHDAPFPRPLAAEVGEPSVIAPDGRVARFRLAPGLAGEPRTVVLSRPSEPGVYRLLAGNRLWTAEAVNLDPRESEPARLDVSTLLDALSAWGFAVPVSTGRGDSGHTNPDAGDGNGDNDASATLALDSAASEDAQPLWGWLLTVALGAIAIELSLLGWWRR